MKIEDVLATCAEHNCVMLEPRKDIDAAVRNVFIEQGKLRVVYSLEALVELFKTRDGMTEEEALDWISYNVEPSQCEGWPIIASEG